MNIIKIERHSREELMANMRRVSMLKRPEVKCYEGCDITLERMHTDLIAPAQRYVLAENVLRARELEWALEKHGIDLFDLDGYVSIWRDDCEDQIDVLPPVVELSREADGSAVNILNDGMHRVYLARMERKPVKVVYVSGVPEEYPYYSYPLVRGWDDVEIRDELPEGYIKKWHRIEDYKSLYRNFNSGFVNVGGPRGHFSKEERKTEAGAGAAASGPGDRIRLGLYHGEEIVWRVLDARDGKLLVISEQALDCAPYNKTYEDITWEKCTLRSWLNGAFFEEAFDAAEKARIAETEVNNNNSAGDPPVWGGFDTLDKIFLLSRDEAEKYFAGYEQRACKPTAYAKTRHIYREGEYCRWWLRSPGASSKNAVYVNEAGDVFANGFTVHFDSNGVRPCMWIK
ncbi:MAG: hypothetical protein IK083_01795 [Abditibacteriota bacterium]|nr:hypothetical protein [Abditibacteriota bacterium]